MTLTYEDAKRVHALSRRERELEAEIARRRAEDDRDGWREALLDRRRVEAELRKLSPPAIEPLR